MGKARLYNRRFLQMRGHYLVEPVACTPASCWEKGQIENQVGLVRERFFTPRLRFKTYEEMNAWLLERCVVYAKAHPILSCATRRSGRCSSAGAAISSPTAVPRRVPRGGGLGLQDLPGPQGVNIGCLLTVAGADATERQVIGTPSWYKIMHFRLSSI